MRPFAECCCGRLHASTSGEWHKHDSELCGQGSELRMVTRTAVNSVSNLKISVDQSENDALVRLNGRIDVGSSPDLRDCLLAILSAEPLPRVIKVDLAGVPYIETSGIATLIEALRIARHHQTGFCLQGFSGPVLKLFEVTGVLALFEANDYRQKVS